MGSRTPGLRRRNLLNNPGEAKLPDSRGSISGRTRTLTFQRRARQQEVFELF